MFDEITHPGFILLGSSSKKKSDAISSIREQENGDTLKTIKKAKLIKTLKKGLLELKLGANKNLRNYSLEK